MSVPIAEIIETANRMVADIGTRDPYKMVRELGIDIIPMNFKRQHGAYKVVMRNRFIFISQNLHPVMENIVILHEIGHDTFHRDEAVKAGVFKEFSIFDMRESRMEYEANIFTAQLSLDDDEILEYISQGYDVQQIARAMYSDINLVALKADALMLQGYNLRPQEYRKEFLK